LVYAFGSDDVLIAIKDVTHASSLHVKTPASWERVLPKEFSNQYWFVHFGAILELARVALTTKDKPAFAVPDFSAAGKMAMRTLPLPG